MPVSSIFPLSQEQEPQKEDKHGNNQDTQCQGHIVAYWLEEGFDGHSRH
jgi:hypothetical protein